MAYKFKNTESYFYSGDDQEEALITQNKKRKAVVSKPKVDAETRAKIAEEKADARALAQSKKEEEAR